MPKSLCLLMTLFLLSPLVSAEIFKCNGENGKIIYQNFRCELDSIGSAATATAPQEQAAAASQNAPVQVRPKVVSIEAATTDRAVGAPGEPRIGMRTEQVKASNWGQPVEMTTAEGEYGVVKKWSYGGTRVVVFNRRGRVVAIER